jgi:NADH-quinone oxidoreductase subunit J
VDVLVTILATLAVVSACGVVFSRQAVHSALYLTGNLLSIALLYLVMHLQFLAVAQMLIYAGAIMVVFLFAVTVLSPTENLQIHFTDRTRLLGVCVAAFVGAGLSAILARAAVSESSMGAPPSRLDEIAAQLFGRFVLPFECIAFVLLIALMGAVLLGHRRQRVREIEELRGD